jgi:hypothetical protein
MFTHKQIPPLVLTPTSNIVIQTSDRESPQLLSVSDALGANWTQAVRDKITNVEYVDLGSLVFDRIHTREVNPFTISGVNQSGKIVFKEKRYKQIHAIDDWTSASEEIGREFRTRCVEEV